MLTCCHSQTQWAAHAKNLDASSQLFTCIVFRPSHMTGNMNANPSYRLALAWPSDTKIDQSQFNCGRPFSEGKETSLLAQGSFGADQAVRLGRTKGRRGYHRHLYRPSVNKVILHSLISIKFTWTLKLCSFNTIVGSRFPDKHVDVHNRSFSFSFCASWEHLDLSVLFVGRRRRRHLDNRAIPANP